MTQMGRCQVSHPSGFHQLVIYEVILGHAPSLKYLVLHHGLISIIMHYTS